MVAQQYIKGQHLTRPITICWHFSGSTFGSVHSNLNVVEFARDVLPLFTAGNVRGPANGPANDGQRSSGSDSALRRPRTSLDDGA